MTQNKDVAASATANGGLYLYEFLYRGRTPGSDQSPDYHVILAQDVADAFDHTSTATSQAMTPAQAEAKGFPLPAIVAAIDAATMNENSRLKAELSDRQAEIEAVEAERTSLQAKLGEAVAKQVALQMKLEAAEAERAAPTEKMDTAAGPVPAG